MTQKNRVFGTSLVGGYGVEIKIEADITVLVTYRRSQVERECLQYGFSEEQTGKLLHGQTVNYSGWLHSNEYRRNALANNVTAQVIADEKRFLFLHINETPIVQWFKEQFGLGQEQRRGIKM